MLTPRDIEKKEFSHTRNNGYKTEEVEDFLEEIIADYSLLIEERENLSNRVLALSDKLETIRDEQEVWKKTLMNTQKSYDEIVDSAKQKATVLLKAANDKANSIVSDAKNESIKINDDINNLVKRKNFLSYEVEEFKKKLLAAYEMHIKDIQNIPSIETESPVEVKNDSKANENSDNLNSSSEETIIDDEVKSIYDDVINLSNNTDESNIDQPKAVEEKATDNFETQENTSETEIHKQELKENKQETMPEDDDDDILVSNRKSTVNTKKSDDGTTEEKLRNLFANNKFNKTENNQIPVPEEKQKVKKKKRVSRFFVDDDDDDDDDFYDED